MDGGGIVWRRREEPSSNGVGGDQEQGGDGCAGDVCSRAGDGAAVPVAVRHDLGGKAGSRADGGRSGRLADEDEGSRRRCGCSGGGTGRNGNDEQRIGFAGAAGFAGYPGTDARDGGVLGQTCGASACLPSKVECGELTLLYSSPGMMILKNCSANIF